MTIQEHNFTHVIPQKPKGKPNRLSWNIRRILNKQCFELLLIKDKVRSEKLITTKNVDCSSWYQSQTCWGHDCIRKKSVVPLKVTAKTRSSFNRIEVVGLCKLQNLSIAKIGRYVALEYFIKMNLRFYDLLFLERREVAPAKKNKSCLRISLCAHTLLSGTYKSVGF